MLLPKKTLVGRRGNGRDRRQLVGGRELQTCLDDPDWVCRCTSQDARYGCGAKMRVGVFLSGVE
jgi:hypothetical protein